MRIGHLYHSFYGRGNSGGGVKYYDIPSEFVSAGFTNNIWRVGDEMFTDYDFTAIPASITGEACYIDPINGNDENDGTEQAPFKTWGFAMSQPFNTFYFKRGTRSKYSDSNESASITKPIKLLAYGEGAAPEITTQGEGFEWIRDTENFPSNPVYYADNPYEGIPIGGCFDQSNIDSDGQYISLDRWNTTFQVNAAANRFAYRSDINRIYIRTFDGREPDDNIVVLLGKEILNFANSNAHAVYAEGLRFFGGAPVSLINNGTLGVKPVGFLNCHFSYAGGMTGTTKKNAVSLHGCVRGFLKDCSAYYNQDDGYNYSDNDPRTIILEWNCLYKTCVYNQGVAQQITSVNGSTAHEAFTLIRVLGNYQGSSGKPLTDITNAKSLNIRCQSGNSLVSSGVNSAGYSTQANDANETIMYLIECRKIGTGDYGIWMEGNSGLANVYDGTYGNILTEPQSIDSGSVLNELTEQDVYK